MVRVSRGLGMITQDRTSEVKVNLDRHRPAMGISHIYSVGIAAVMVITVGIVTKMVMVKIDMDTEIITRGKTRTDTIKDASLTVTDTVETSIGTMEINVSSIEKRTTTRCIAGSAAVMTIGD
jgi:hypothetical protein